MPCYAPTIRSNQLELLCEYPNLARVVVENTFGPLFSRYAEADFDELIALIMATAPSEGVLQEFIDKSECAAFITQGYWGVVRQWYVGGMVESAAQLAKRLTCICSFTLMTLMNRQMSEEWMQALRALPA